MNELEEKHRSEFRNSNIRLCEQLRPRIELIKIAKGKDDRSGLYNVGIIFNNKMSEILHHYYKRDVNFFTDNIISNAIYDYLSLLRDTAVLELECYLKNYVIVHNRIAVIKPNMSDNLDMYRDYIEDIHSFNLSNDIPKILKDYINTLVDIDDNYRYYYINNVEKFIKSIKELLEQLELQHLYDECERIITVEAVRCAALIYQKESERNEKVYRQ